MSFLQKGLFNPNDVNGLEEKLEAIEESEILRDKLDAHNLKKRNFGFEGVVEKLSRKCKEVYELESV